MAFQFTPTRPPDSKIATTTSGNTPSAWRMLGDNGAAGLGKSKWVELHGVQWKSWLLRAAQSPYSAAVGAASVEVHVANELDPADADANTAFVVLGTLNSGAPMLSTEPPFRFMRVEVKVAGGVPVQVDFNGIGV